MKARSCPLVVFALLGPACAQPATPCQRLMDELAANGQAMLSASAEPVTLAALVKKRPAAASWNIPSAGERMTPIRTSYEQTLQDAAAAAVVSDEQRTAAVLATKATIVALNDVGVVCAGER